MHKRLIEYINKNSILYNHQYGLRNKRSTNLAILELVDKIAKAIENKEFAVGIFLNLSKAFDTVNHNIPLKKLHFYGNRVNCRGWLKNYSTERKQIVKYYDSKSIDYGMPQGSVLGPLLFLIYINDIFESTKITHFILFDDDTNLFYSGKDAKKLALTTNIEIKKMDRGSCSYNQLTLFKSKSKQMNEIGIV